VRRQFDLPEDDVETLEALGLPWETLALGGARWVIVSGFPVPEGYTHTSADVAVQISPGYPTAQLDMAYFNPPLARRDGQPIGALSSLSLDGKVWQRWSRHRTSTNPWRPGVDDLGSHLRSVEDWLAREFRIR
jgi:hypothetical protein